MYVIKGSALHISVRNLVEFLCRGGDIDAGSGLGTDVTAMQEGARIHRLIQHRMGAKYHAEVPLKYKCDYDEYSISIEGRADGIICDMDEDEDGNKTPVSDVIIDEIKTMQTDVTKMKEAVYVHKAQAMCYAYIYATQHNLEKITVQMTYCNSETEEIKRFAEDFSYDEINKWYENLMKQFKKWTDFIFEQRQLRQESIGNLEFPFEYREGQRELVVSVYKTINRGKTLYIQAPTGVGKTIATIFPAVAAMGQNKADKIFYLTSKTITRTVAENTYVLLRENGLHFRTVTLTARDKICMAEKRECNPVNCEYAKGHFDRVNDAIFDAISNNEVIDRTCIEKYALKHRVCPFEMSLDISYWCDGIICDYNYVFDPNVALKRYFGEKVKGDYIFLVDEAHNLVDRAREMYSASIVKEDFLEIKKLLKTTDAGYIDKRLVSWLDKCNKSLLEMKRECDDYRVFGDITSLKRLPEYLEYLSMGISSFLDKNKKFEKKDELLEFFFKIKHFLAMYDCADEKYVIYCEHDDEGNFVLRLYCVDPSGNISDRISMGCSTIFFSATLLPVNYYKEMLSGEIDDYAVYAHSPFKAEKKCIVASKDVSSRYTRRNDNEYEKICRYIYETVNAKKGNYMVFFPSYGYMENVKNMFMENYSCRPAETAFTAGEDICGNKDYINIYIATQRNGMNEEDREQFLKLFEEEKFDGSLIGMCVTGGIFSEGIDLKNDSLIGAVIVGTGLPMICRERNILRDYFDANEKDGYSYAYVYPGMIKVLQAAGRVIRTDEDRGVIELLDDRFLRPEYQKMYPREWENVISVRRENVRKQLDIFWKN